MKERFPNTPFAIIIFEAVRADSENKDAQQCYLKSEEKAQNLFSQAFQILNRYRSEAKLGTPPLEFEYQGKKVSITLEEDSTSPLGYKVDKDKISLKAVFSGGLDSQPRKLFSISRNGKAMNWLGKEATVEQMATMKNALTLIGKSLLAVNRGEPQNLR